ncbi:hypothetical protein P8918_13515 [Bacillus spizizenii]|nr:glycine zipper family protein [Bacillus spizizenii]MCY8890322.1 glycine zipper family protein [Bacillus spizizenii]MEC0842046.1 hypothetical protein [Bacillus spizizenii]
MSDERLREDAQKSSLDHMASLGKAALTVGVGAALFYRGGGKNILSRGASISEKFLTEAKNEIGSRNLSELKTTDVKSIYNSLIGSPDNALKRARESAINGTMRLRVDDSRNGIGMIQENYLRLLREQDSMIRQKYESAQVKYPAAQKFVKEFAPNEPKLGRQIERFIFDAANHLDDPSTLRRITQGHNLDKNLTKDQLDRMLDFMSKRMRDEEGFTKFQQDHQKVIDEALSVALDPDEMARMVGSKDSKTAKQKFMDKVLGDQAATYDDLLANADKFEGNFVIDRVIDKQGKGRDVVKEATNFVAEIRNKIRETKGEEAASKFGRLYVDPNVLRIDKDGNFYNFTQGASAVDDFLESFSHTLPGKIFKTRDIGQRAKGPSFNFTPASGSLADPMLARLANKHDNNSFNPDTNYLRMMDKVYEFSVDGLRHEKALDDTYLISRYGTRPRLLNQIAGNVDYRESNNKVFRALDVFQEGNPTVLDDIKSKINKFKDPNWSGNVIDSFLNESRNMKQAVFSYKSERDNLSEEAIEDIHKIIDKTKNLNHFFSKNTYELSSEAVNKLMSQSSGRTKELFGMLTNSNEDMLKEIITQDHNSLRDITSHANQDLVSLLNKYVKNPKRARDMISLKTDRANFFGGTESAGFFDTLRMEIGKEAFMQHALSTGPDQKRYNFDAVSELIESAGLKEGTKRETRRLADWAAFQQATEVHSRFTRKKDPKDLLTDADRILDVFLEPEDKTQMNAEYFRQFRNNLDNMSKEKVSIFENSYSTFQDTAGGFMSSDAQSEVVQAGLQGSSGIFSADRQNEWVHMKKMISPLDVIQNLNDTEKLKAFGKQFVAGRNNLEDVTTATLAPYFGVIRLSDALSKIGLSFSVKSTGSVGDLTKAIALKRALPLVAGMTYYDYLSDMTGAVTGTTLNGAFASGIANVDLGMRKLTDATGLTDFLKDEKEINPFLSYYTGDDYMSYDERKDWYENGYSEMRKARWWNFGSINEWRGTEIQYYQPNYLRRATSNWKDAALYDNVWEKWSRSWLPTPTAPLSPVRYLMNPYWLEEKHADDRPYPMTGSMFTEQTPWGAILNPTVGEIVKPKRQMHADRLDSNYVDVRALIEARNREQFDRAKDETSNHLIRFKEGVIEPVTYTTFNAPTPSERVLNLQVYNGQIQGASMGSYQQFTGVMSARDYLEGQGGLDKSGEALEDDIVIGGSGGETGEGLGGGRPHRIEGLSFKDEIAIRARNGEILPAIQDMIMSKVDPTYDIEEINKGIMERAQAIGSTPNESGVVTPESIYKGQARYGSHVLENREAVADLKGIKGGDDFVGELAYTSRFMAGIYGYGTFRMFPGQPRSKLEDASTMDSPVRTLWDANFGGLGGGYVEIFRRFIPSQNVRVNEINPLLNTMPDWMPERFRFGDPYTKLPKGEMRLPGRGFESLNDLHPDDYGAYGAFDRFKILADIAPYSHEYKVWRDIASRTIDDPDLKEEMDNIRERVTKQSQKYDFHKYQFIGKSLERNVVTVEEIVNNNYFKVVGDDKMYRLAGISVSGGEEGENVLQQYLAPGMEVVMATDKNPYDSVNDDEYNSVNASIFIQGENLNKQLLKDGMATKRENDQSAAAAQGQYSDFQIARGYAFEALAHAPIPYFQQKYFKIRDPLESYKHELVYGTPYASWSFPMKSFIEPAFQRSLMSDGEVALGIGALAMNQMVHNYSSSGTAKKMANAGLMLANRGAFIGGFSGLMLSGGGRGTKLAAQVGAVAQMGAWLYTRSDQPIEGTVGFAAVGATVGRVLKDVGIKKGAGVGAAVGLALSGSQSSVFDDEGLLDKTWIPERTREKWELQEYFDRLEYIKYSGLYEKAARKAYLHEGTDIKKLVNQYERSQEANNEMRNELNEYKEIIKSVYPQEDSRAARMLSEIDSKLSAIEDTEMLMTTGKWGRTALIYKQAMDSTIYGLNQDASWAQLLRAIPSNERDHFIEFSKERDPEKRKEILKFVSPYQKKALQIAWGEKPNEQESMSSFFGNHNLPAPTWSGWRPNVDMKNIEVKTIQNEGLLLSDFGYYESQLRDPQVIMADAPNPDDSSNAIAMRTSLLSALKGYGLTGVNVSVEPSDRNGVEVVADIARITTYNVQQKLKDLISF